MTLGNIGKKQVEVLSKFLGTGLVYGASAGLLVTYMSEWKAVLQYLPYYNGKYPKEDN